MKDWSPANKPLDPWYTKQPYIYVMRRRDGWHKIGHCYGDARFRAYSVHYRTQHALRPVELVWSTKVASQGIITLEHAAHKLMVSAGFKRAGEQVDTEWFNATAKDCIKAVKLAIKSRT